MQYKDPAAHIQGWLHPVCAAGIQAVAEIQKNANVIGHSLEIGVYLGKTLAHLATFRREEEITIGIDPFKFTYSGGRTEDIYDKAIANIKSLNSTHSINGETILMRGISSDQSIKNRLQKYKGKIRIASIDGSHEHLDVLNDLCLMDDLLMPEGVIILDDFCNPINPEVTSALKEFICDTSIGHKWQLAIAISPSCSPRKGSSRLFLNRKGISIDYQFEIARLVKGSNIKDITSFQVGDIKMFGMNVFVMFQP